MYEWSIVGRQNGVLQHDTKGTPCPWGCRGSNLEEPLPSRWLAETVSKTETRSEKAVGVQSSRSLSFTL